MEAGDFSLSSINFSIMSGLSRYLASISSVVLMLNSLLKAVFSISMRIVGMTLWGWAMLTLYKSALNMVIPSKFLLKSARKMMPLNMVVVDLLFRCLSLVSALTSER
ncbi:hypothetical protein D3C87_1773250 [compost metagenome]